MDKNVFVLIPTYNESTNIVKLVYEIMKVNPNFHILVIDDNSPDHTAETVEKLQETFKNLHLIKRTGKLGVATAYMTGFKYALDHQADYVFQMDADFSHDPKHLPQFINEMDKADVVIGSRWVENGGVQDWGMLRKLISTGGSFYSRKILNLPIRDVTGGFKCFKANVLRAIDFNSIRSRGFSFQIEMNYIVHLLGFKIVETPIYFVNRKLGESKMSFNIFISAFVNVWFIKYLHRKNILEQTSATASKI